MQQQCNSWRHLSLSWAASFSSLQRRKNKAATNQGPPSRMKDKVQSISIWTNLKLKTHIVKYRQSLDRSAESSVAKFSSRILFSWLAHWLSKLLREKWGWSLLITPCQSKATDIDEGTSLLFGKPIEHCPTGMCWMSSRKADILSWSDKRTFNKSESAVGPWLPTLAKPCGLYAWWCHPLQGSRGANAPNRSKGNQRAAPHRECESSLCDCKISRCQQVAHPKSWNRKVATAIHCLSA